jgi:hypothetical protein
MQGLRITTTRRTIFLCAMLLTCTLAHAQTPAPPPKPTGGIPTLTFDLKTRTADGVLPFDEPFRIKAPVTTDVVNVNVQFGPVRREQDCPTQELLDLLMKEPIEGRIVDPGLSTAELHILSREKYIVPNRLICFVFGLQEKLPATFRAAVREKYDALARTAMSPTLSDADLDALRLAAASALNAVAAERKVSIDLSTSVFAAGTPPARLEQVFIRDLAAVISAQDNKQPTMDAFCDDRALAISALQAIQTPNGPLDHVLSTIDAARLTLPAIRTLVSEHRAAFRALQGTALGAELGQDAMCTIQNGVPVAGAPLLAVWHPEELAGHDKSLGATIAHFADARVMIGELAKENFKLADAISADHTKVLQAQEDLTRAEEMFGGARRALQEVTTTLRARDTTLDTLAQLPEVHANRTVPLIGTSVATFETRQRAYVSADIGLGTAWELKESFGYAGVNFYTRPINKNATLDWRVGELDWWRKRFSGVIGVTVQNVERANEYKGVMAGRALVTAVGFRVLEGVRISVGGIVVRKFENPLVDESKVRMSPFVSFSIDWDVRSALGQFNTLIGGTP